MSLPTHNPIPLPSTFHHAAWEIKYALLPPIQTIESPELATAAAPPQPQTLVLVHGTPWSSTVFAPLIRSLQTTHPHLQILFYDLPGYGQSQTLTTTTNNNPPTPPSPRSKDFSSNNSVKTQASALAALLSHLSLDGKGFNAKPAVLAHDIAGTIALRAHLLHGCEFSRLLLLDTNCVLPWGDGFYKLAHSEPHVFRQLPGRVHEAVVREVVRSASVRATASTPSMRADGWEEWEDALAAPWIGSAAAQEGFVRQIAQAEDGDVAEMFMDGGEGCLYRSVGCQVRIMWGDGDEWIPKDKMEALCRLLGERLEEPLVVIEGAGHLLMLDQPAKVEEEVRNWLRGL